MGNSRQILHQAPASERDPARAWRCGWPATGPWRRRCPMRATYSPKPHGRDRLDRGDAGPVGLGRWDSVLPAFLYAIAGAARAKGAVLVADAAPEGLQRLLWRSPWPCPRAPRPRAALRPNPLARLGLAAMGAWGRMVDAVNFIGEVVLALVDVLRGRAQYRVEDVARVFYQAGPAALPIVTLIGLLGRRHPGPQRRQPARHVRRADLRRQPGHDRHGAGDGAADGGGDHGRAHRCGLRRRARHHAGQPGDRRPAHAGRSTRCSSWSCRACWP